jgi:hypothetical protein
MLCRPLVRAFSCPKSRPGKTGEKSNQYRVVGVLVIKHLTLFNNCASVKNSISNIGKGLLEREEVKSFRIWDKNPQNGKMDHRKG